VGDAAVQDAEHSGSQRKVVPGVRGTPEYQLADLRAALETALQASIAWDTSPDQSEANRQQLTDHFYLSFSKLGETVTFLRPGDPAARELAASMQQLLLAFAEQPKKLAMIGNQSSDWLDQPTRNNQGIFLFGTVKEVRHRGDVFETEMELASRKERSLTVISRLDPRPMYSRNDLILMLGAIVENPAENLAGYGGNEPMVVMGGFPVPISP
jgi:hypothetical protein